MAAQMIVGLAILVVIHEFGHFIAARAFGIRVEKFYLFFDAWGFKLFKFKYKDTEYGIGWLPFGGYVKISGMIDESMDKEAMKKPPQPWEFRSKPAWQRLIVMLAGVVMNLILGVLIFAFWLFTYEGSYLSNTQVNQDGIYAYETGRNLGFMDGDKIISIDGKEIERFKDVTNPSVLFGAEFVVERDGKSVEIIIPDTLFKKLSKERRFIDNSNFGPITIDSVLPNTIASEANLRKSDRIISINGEPANSYGFFREQMVKNKSNEINLQLIRGNDTLSKNIKTDSTALLGILIGLPYSPEEYTFGKAMKYGYQDAIMMLMVNAKGMGRVVSGKEKATESLSGPIGIANIYGGKWEWSRFWYITGLLSLILAFMNILPIPALDGGHVIFLLVEIVTRRKPSDKFLEYAQVVGMVILLALMVFVIGLDLLKHVF